MLRRGGGGESRTPVRKRFPRNFSGRRRLFWESCSPSSLSCRQAVTPTGQVSFIVHGRFKALPAHVHHETTPVPGPWSSRVRRPLFKQRRERYRYRSLIYKLPVFRWSGATARYSCFRVPVETGTPPRRHKSLLSSVSAWRRKLRWLPCSSSPNRTRLRWAPLRMAAAPPGEEFIF